MFWNDQIYIVVVFMLISKWKTPQQSYDCLIPTIPFLFGKWFNIRITGIIYCAHMEQVIYHNWIFALMPSDLNTTCPETGLSKSVTGYFIITVQWMMSANSRIRLGLQIVFICLYSTPSQLWHFPKNTRSCVENECCCPRTVNMSNVNFI